MGRASTSMARVQLKPKWTTTRTSAYNYHSVLADNLGEEDFQKSWAKQVSKEFKIDEHEVYTAYSSADKYGTSAQTRGLWKYAAAKGVFGTPTAFVNGTKLDSVPGTVKEW